MSSPILVIYRTSTGFTKDYAEMIAEALSCDTLDFKHASSEAMSKYDTIIYGGSFHAGLLGGLKKARELFGKSTAAHLVLFGTGATPIEAGEIIDQAWANNLTPDELKTIPHFYMPSGLRYERMPLPDKLLMKAFAAMMKNKKDKDDYEKGFEAAISSSYDISSKDYITPLVEAVKAL